LLTIDSIQDSKKRKVQFNILLIEDNPTDTLLVQSHIEKLVDFSLQTVEVLSQGLESLNSHNFDVILLDLNLPDALGLEGLIKLRRHVQSIPIVVLTGVNDEQLGIMALQRGAQDYLIKGKDNGRLTKAIRYAIERMLVHGIKNSTVDESYLDVDTTKQNSSLIENERKARQQEVLTERELQVLKLLGKGCSNQEIAEHLLVSVNTVKTHIANVLHKLSVSDRTKAVLEAQHLGLI
jgi:DNA-binding NarL/FixJ family response regulator